MRPGDVSIFETVNNVCDQQAIFTSDPATVGQTHSYKATYDPATGVISVWRNSTFLGSWTDTSNPRTSGSYIALRTTESSVRFDNIKVSSTGAGFLYLHSDHLGSTSLMTYQNGSFVNGSQSYYLPFGGYRGTPPTANPVISDRGYTGHKHNNDVGLIYMNARFYVSSIGRFASADAIVPDPTDPQSYNRYSYVRNNPLNYTDPTGHAQQCFDCSDTDVNAMLQYFAEYGANEGLFNEYYAAVYIEAEALANALSGDHMILGEEYIQILAIQASKAMYYERAVNHLGQDAWAGTMVGGGPNTQGVVELQYAFGAPRTPSSNRPSVGTSTIQLDGGCSFSADTLVATADGLVPISEIEVGDYVLAYDEAEDEIGYHPVEAVWVHEDPVIVYLTVAGEVIETTPDHPFYAITSGWVEAEDLWLGALLLRSDSSLGQVQAIELDLRPQLMYDLSVSEVHTFFVGRQQLLVHNCNLGDPDAAALRDLIDDATVGGRQPLSVREANTILDWAGEIDYPGWRASPGDVTGTDAFGSPHIHIPQSVNGGHIPVDPGVAPRINPTLRPRRR